MNRHNLEGCTCVCHLEIFILTVGSLIAAALTSAVMSTPRDALEYNIYMNQP